jgi:glycosyltransferase involved in cell wall biosynthesis
METLDLCLWARNGARYLTLTLKRIDKVIPSVCVNQKIFVDDSSVDETREIAKKYGWTVYDNREGYVSGGIREAFRHVETELFCTFEQDVLLPFGWLEKIIRHMEDENVIVALGTGLDTNKVMKAIEHFREPSRVAGFWFGDDIFRTSLVKELGGFPNTSRLWVDREFNEKVLHSKYRIIIDRNVVCLHMKGSVRDCMDHQYRLDMIRGGDDSFFFPNISATGLIMKGLATPFLGFKCAVKENCPQAVWAYPYVRLMSMKEFLRRPRKAGL